MKRNILLIAILFIVAAAGIGYYLWNKKTPDVVDDKPDAVVTAANLLAAFDKDTATAGKQYLNKVLQVTGWVKSVDTSGAVVLGEEGTESSVVCGMDRRHTQEIGTLKPGATATLQGRCTGYEKGEEMMGISLGTTVHLAFAGIKKQ